MLVLNSGGSSILDGAKGSGPDVVLLGSGLAVLQHGGRPKVNAFIRALFFVCFLLLPLPSPSFPLPSPPSPSTQCPQAFPSPAAQPGDNQPGMGSPGTPQRDPDWIHSQIRGLYVPPFLLLFRDSETPFLPFH